MSSVSEYTQVAGEEVDSAPILRVSNVTVRFGGMMALSGVSLQMGAGQITGLVGPNGAGKSTLFDVMSGFRVPSEGEVFLGDTRITKYSPNRRARLGLVRSFQRPDLFTSLSVAEHVLLGVRLRNGAASRGRDFLTGAGWRGASDLERAEVAVLLSRLHLDAYAAREVATLPTGISRLVEVARVLSLQPRIVLLDEPAAGLDSRETTALRDALLGCLSDQDITLLVVEHDLDFVLGLSHRAYVLDSGKVIAVGSPVEIRKHPSVIDAYLGDQG